MNLVKISFGDISLTTHTAFSPRSSWYSPGLAAGVPGLLLQPEREWHKVQRGLAADQASSLMDPALPMLITAFPRRIPKVQVAEKAEEAVSGP